jgi:hypothetical protein
LRKHGKRSGHRYTRVCPERAELMDFIYKEVIQEEDVNKCSVRRKYRYGIFTKSQFDPVALFQLLFL